MDSESEQEAMCGPLTETLSGWVTEQRRPPHYAFLSTSFGFGPVSKAVSIAQELRERSPHVRLHFFGAGIDCDFAVRNDTFDEVIKADVDSTDVLAGLVRHLSHYDSVFSVLNFEIVNLWSDKDCPLYLVDSLAWMWASPPRCLANVQRYYIQDYLVDDKRKREWSRIPCVKVIPPIELASSHVHVDTESGTRRLVVNLSGCANPFVDENMWRLYAGVLTDLVIDVFPEMYDEVQICCKKSLVDFLRTRAAGAHGDVRVDYLPHDAFMECMASASMLLTTPGITTTLEALSLGTPIAYLLPHNYSQALISERYHSAVDGICGMPLLKFGAELSVPEFMPEEHGVDFVWSGLQQILETQRPQVKAVLNGFTEDAARKTRDALRDYPEWTRQHQGPADHCR